jgi:hypothetical protein
MNMKRFRCVGIHPLAAFGMIAVDLMLFSSDVTGIGWLLSCAIAGALTIPCLLLQKFSYLDNWPLAISKALLVGLLTAIPTPLPSFVTGSSGVAGIAGMVTKPKKPAAQKHGSTVLKEAEL